MNINNEVSKIYIYFLQLKNKKKKLEETKNELLKQIKEKDDAILELSKYYDVSNINNIILQKVMEMKNKKKKDNTKL